MSEVTVIIVAAGEGRRFGFSKQFALLGGKSVLDRCLEMFEAHKKVAAIVLVLKDVSLKKEYLKRYRKIVAVAKGGKGGRILFFRDSIRLIRRRRKLYLFMMGLDR